jgi:hypothetical protein
MLDYLFTAYYADNTTYQQTEEDRSTKDETKSAYYDIDQDKLIAFALQGANDGVVVDLRTGLFVVNGLPLSVFEGEVVNRRLIYFRRVTQQMNREDGQTSTSIEYHIGWQGNDPVTGQNIQRVIAF